MLLGSDYSFGSGVTAAQIKAHGPFVMRYLSGGNTKDVSAAELQNFKAAGVAVGFVWETNGTPSSAALGTSHAKSAQAQLQSLANAIGDQSLTKATVYFAIDEESNPYSVSYIANAAAVLGKARTGVYGGYGTVSEVMDAGVCEYAWQTYAWSSGAWDTRAILRQVQNDIKIGPCDADADEIAYFNVATPVFAAADLTKVGFVFGPAATTPPAAPAAPALPSFAAPKVSAKAAPQITVSWTAVPSAVTYFVQVADSTGKTVYASNTLTGTSVTVPVAAAGEYTYRIQVNAVAGKIHTSPWSATQKVTA